MLYYIARLLYAEYCEERGDLSEVTRLLVFLQYYPSTWQAFKDRALQLLDRIEAETGTGLAAEMRSLPAGELIDSVVSAVPAPMR